jgi:hypothetical protein
MRDKKSFKKNTHKMNEELKHALEDLDDKAVRERDMKGKSNDQLFAVNAAKNSLKREKLRKDRFADKRRASTSKTDQILVKRLRDKQTVAKEVDPELAEMQDLWATDNTRAKKWEHHEAQKKKAMPVVKAVIKPMSG